MTDFWNRLPKPIFALAPLANVTDAAFRRLIAKYGKPHGPAVMFTEFVSADGLVRGNRDVLLHDLAFGESERPIVAQLFTGRPDMMAKAAALVGKLGFDGIDINMGCPDRSIERAGAGAALIKTPKLARELIAAAREGGGGLPVSVKTRLGYNKDVLDEWLPALLEMRPAAITIHARTRKEMSRVPARWERIARGVELRNACQGDTLTRTLIIGNGDLKNIKDAKAKIEDSGADGAMLGRAIFGNPSLFAHSRELANDVKERLRIAVEHARLFEKLLGDVKNFAVMKKHFTAYVEGFPGAKELRMRLMETESAAEIEEIIESFLAAREEDALPDRPLLASA